MQAKIKTDNAEVNTAINSLSETLEEGLNGVKCTIEALAINCKSFVLDGNLSGYVLAKRMHNGEYVSWCFSGKSTYWGDYYEGYTEEEARKAFIERAKTRDCLILRA